MRSHKEKERSRTFTFYVTTVVYVASHKGPNVQTNKNFVTSQEDPIHAPSGGHEIEGSGKSSGVESLGEGHGVSLPGGYCSGPTVKNLVSLFLSFHS